MSSIPRRYLARSGPSRREYQRAHYQAHALPAPAHPVPSPPAPDRLITKEVIDYRHRSFTAAPDEATGAALLSALVGFGASLAESADHRADALIGTHHLRRPTTPQTAVNAARAAFVQHQSRWIQIERTVRAAVGRPLPSPLRDEDLFGPHIPRAHQRWNRAARTELEASRTDLIATVAAAAGEDPGWAGRQRIRADCYRELTGATALGMIGSTQLPIPDRWRACVDELSSRPGLADAVALFTAHRTHTRLAVPVRFTADNLVEIGGQALFSGRYGGLIGDGYRSSDLEARAFLLALWALL